jgi:lysophospholipase L1-like esterase
MLTWLSTKIIWLALLYFSPAYAHDATPSFPSMEPAATKPAATSLSCGSQTGDWACIGRYRKADADLVARHVNVQTVFIGDSITAGWARQPSFRGDASRLGRGISGQTAAQMLVRFRSDVINLKPDVVHIMAGTNDVGEVNGMETDDDIEGYIASMVELAQAHGIKVILASIPPVADFHWHPGLNPAPRIKNLNQWLQHYAGRKNIVYADYWSALATPLGGMRPEFSKDGVHPNLAGYSAMEPLLAAAIKRALQ